MPFLSTIILERARGKGIEPALTSSFVMAGRGPGKVEADSARRDGGRPMAVVRRMLGCIELSISESSAGA